MAASEIRTIYVTDFYSLNEILDTIFDTPNVSVRLEINPSAYIEKITEFWIRMEQYIMEHNTTPWFEANLAWDWNQKPEYLETYLSFAMDPKQYYIDIDDTEIDMSRYFLLGLYSPISQLISQNPGYGFLSGKLTIPRYSSGRPKHDMPFISLSIPEIEIIDSKETYAPVIRYAMGMSRGAYYTGIESLSSKYCGTFYYYEPDSKFFLRLGKFQIFRNKYHAYYILGPNKRILQRFLRHCSYAKDGYEEDDIHKFLVGELKSITNIGDVTLDADTNITSLREYFTDAYGEEDQFDQDICKLAITKDIECIILTHMPGRFRLVSEIMDARERDISYANLVKLRNL